MNNDSKEKTNYCGGNNVTANHEPFLWTDFFYISEFNTKHRHNLLECCPVGGNLQGKEKTATAETVTMQHTIKFKLEQLSSS